MKMLRISPISSISLNLRIMYMRSMVFESRVVKPTFDWKILANCATEIQLCVKRQALNVPKPMRNSFSIPRLPL